nr:hypothetical protein CFP56_67983 [Quercus suber]
MRLSPQTTITSPSASNLPSFSQTEAAITHTEHPETTPTHKEILSDSTLFDTYITNLDHELIHPSNSNIPTPLPQLAHTPLIDPKEHLIYTTQSFVPSTRQTDTWPTNHTITFDPTHTPDTTKISNTNITPTYYTEAEKNDMLRGTVHSETLHDSGHDTLQAENLHGTWHRLGSPRDIMNSSTSSEMEGTV